METLALVAVALASTAVGMRLLLVATAATVWLAIGVESNEEKFDVVRDWEIVLFTTAAVGFLWSAVEAFAYHVSLRRRLALGLGDAIVTNRVLFWGLTGVSAGTALVIVTLLRLMDVNCMSATFALFTAAGCGFLVSVFLCLAFLLPAAYLRWLERASLSDGS